MRGAGVTKQHLAAVVVKNRRHGVHNPDAMYRSEVDAEAVMSSRVVCEPLHLWMLCSPNEGAAAVVLRRSEPTAGDRGSGPIQLAAAVLRSHLPGAVLSESTPMAGLTDDTLPTPTTLAATDAYEVAGLGPRDLDVVECQDTDAGPRADVVRGAGPVPGRRSGRDARSRCHLGRRPPPRQPERRTAVEGRTPGASALGQVVELVHQLRGEAGGPDRSHGARVGLAHTVGRGANAGVVVLRRS